MKTLKQIRWLSIAICLFALACVSAWAAKPDTDLKTPSNAEKDAQGKPTDYNNPKFDGSPNGVPHYHVTVCAGSTLGPWHPWGNKHRDSEPKQTSNKDTTPAAKSGKHHGDASSAGGTDGGVAISGRNEGTTDVKIELKEDDGTVKTIEVTIHVIDCSKHKEGQKGITALPGFPGINPNPLPALIHDVQIKIDITGTGETIGHIADCSIQNLTDQPIYCSVPPSVLESRTGKNQNYVCPRGENIAINSHDSVSIPIDGVCVNRNKQPVGKGVGGDLVMNPGDPNLPGDPACHIPTKDAQKLLHSCAAKYDAVDLLQEDGQLNDMPYKDKKKQKDICIQWSTWTDPEICQLTGAPPATKDDLKKVVYKQMEPHGAMTPETKKKVDQGIDTIFSKIELTTEKAKDLEKTAEPGSDESKPPSTFNINNDNEGTKEKPTEGDKSAAAPKPEEKPVPPTTEKPNKPGKKKKAWTPEVWDWLDKYHALEKAEKAMKPAKDKYYGKLGAFMSKSPHLKELHDKLKAASDKAFGPNGTKEDKAAYDQAQKDYFKQADALEQDFLETPEGKEAYKEYGPLKQDYNKAVTAEAEAKNKLPPGSNTSKILKVEAKYKEDSNKSEKKEDSDH